MRQIEMAGKKFGLLTVREILPGSKCVCDCDCGTVGMVTAGYSVRNGLSRSCGCLKKLGYHTIHGEACSGRWTPEYRAWQNMITRCHNPKATRYKSWGGRGISVCDEWLANYGAFLRHMGRKPSPQHSLDRYPNNDGNYEPGNTRWATRKEQASNTRRKTKCSK